jgi:dihydroorotate dehydrogenase
MINYNSIKPLLFKLEPENAHHVAATLLRLPNICQIPFNPFLESHFINDEILNQELFGRVFLNPVGLGAGFDKNATMIRGIQILGFGFTEIGTVTPKPQAGNPKPRMFRHIDEETLQNAMGFNNDGAYKVVKRLKERFPFTTPIGINIGKNKLTSESEAINDYTHLIKAFDGLGDYFVINISSPNTPGLRDLQNEAFIGELFKEAKALTKMPILLKIAPDMLIEDAITLTKMAVEKGADGIIATNTTIDYSLVREPKDIGGLSGAVLKEKSFKIFEAIAKELYGKTTLISVGGIDSAKEAYRRIKAGASLVQIYSGMVFHGPDMIRDVNLGLIELLKADGYTNITEAIGADRKEHNSAN